MELVHDISEGFLTHDDRKDIDTHQCSIDVIELYINNIYVHLGASKERLLEEYQQKYEIEEMPWARVTRPLSASTLAAAPPDQPAPSKNYGDWYRSLLNKRFATAALTNDTTMYVVKRPADTEPLPNPTPL